MDLKTRKAKSLKGEIEVCPDKSISHRAIFLGALSHNDLKIKNFLYCEDTKQTLHIFKQLGCDFDFLNETDLILHSPKKFSIPSKELYCGNSGTSARLITGILSSQNFSTTLTGDKSLSNRPMKRIIEPINLMGGKILHNNFKLPLKIQGRNLTGINYFSKIPSAQVKSCILFAGLNAQGKTTFEEIYTSRNHTELMLKYFEADIKILKNKIKISKSELTPNDIEIAGDISAAAFFIAAATLIENSDLIIKKVGINSTRIGFIEVLKKMGANIKIFNKRTICNEKIADLRIKFSKLKSTKISGEIIPKLIDEIPILAILMANAEGTSEIKDATELHCKETDRLFAIFSMLKSFGINVILKEDGLIIEGKKKINAMQDIETFFDHRIAMSTYILGLISKTKTTIKNFECVNISYPNFLKTIEKIIK